MNIPGNIIIHHTWVSRTKNYEQFDAVNAFHKRKGWGKIGYHYFIEPNGEVKIGRGEKESGAHTKQKLMNFRSIGICLVGNLDLEDPTLEQCKALYALIERLRSVHKISEGKVYSHRDFATYKSCWGSRLPNDVLGYLQMRLKVTPTWKRTLEKWASKYIKDMDALLQGDPHSFIALVKRSAEDSNS